MLDLALPFLMFVWAFAGKDAPAPAAARPTAARPRPRRPHRPALPRSPAAAPRPTVTRTTAAPWPQVVPAGLPPFPGLGWEYDEPPPPIVQQRAGELLSKLWARGAGTYQVEQTAGRWIVYRAEQMAGGKKGVAAYREKRPVRPAAAAPRPRAHVKVGPAIMHPPPARPVSTSPAPAPASSSPLGLPTLRRGWGARPAPPHPDVKLLQQTLGITPDGRFGPGTEAAVIAYQKRHGLKPDGIVGPKTWAALFPSVRS